jgi:pimeloyl-ACP methyl ester carboxylesterase
VVINKFKPTILIGHSVGGMATVFSHYKYEFNNIEKIILLGTPSELKTVFKRYVDMMSYNKRIEKQINELVFEKFGNYPNNYSTAKFLSKITSEGLIIHDEKDPIIPYNDALLINKSFKNSTLITTHHQGHSLNTVEIVEHVTNFINR